MNRLFIFLFFACVVSAQECWEPHVPGQYVTGAKTSRINHNYQANWTTKETPGAENWGGWKDMGTCVGGTGSSTGSCWTAFKTGLHKTGTEISYLRKNYRANWTTSEIPGVQNWGGWQFEGECTDNTTPITMITLSDTAIIEGAGDNAIVGFLSSNSGDGTTYRLVAGSGDVDNGLFFIQGAILRAKHSLKTSAKSTRLIRIEGMAGNGTKYTKAFTILVMPDTKIDVVTKITETPSMLSQFALYSHDDMNIASGAKITGMIGSNSNVSLADVISAGWQSKIKGDIWVNGSVTTSSEAEIIGDIYTQNGVNLGWNARHTGKKIDSIPAPYFELPQKAVPVSQEDILLAWQESKLLLPGTYGDISVKDGGSITLKAGTYNCKTFSLNSNAIKIYLDLQPGETVELNVDTKLRLGSEAQIVYLRNEAPASFKIFTNQYSELELPYASKIKANIVAPNTTVRINSNCVVYGSIYAKKIDVGNNVTVVRPPYLTDIWHSEWAYAPAFDMNQMNYKGVLPSSSDPIQVEYTAGTTGLNVRMDKSAVSSGDKYLITITDPATTLTSYYTLELGRSAQSTIYVNSTASGSGNGSSWSNAYNNLQNAINDATISGKEIWVAEGLYIPTTQINSQDARTKTFLLPQGVEIIGGFKGTETERKPQGDPGKVVLSGDLAQNDGESFNVVPFTDSSRIKTAENAYHVITITGINRAKSTRLVGMTISNGIANGVGVHGFGGGILSLYAYPNIDMCQIMNNLSNSHGAGIYGGGGLQSFGCSLFKNNTSLSGSGAAVYLNTCKDVELNQVVFENNRALGVAGKSTGGAVFINNADIKFVNSIFTNNYAAQQGGAFFALNSRVKCSHVNVINNTSGNGVGGLVSVGSNIWIANSIVWNNAGEYNGDTINVVNSCVTGISETFGNINKDPMFENRYSDFRKFGVTLGSPCIDAGNIEFSLRKEDFFQFARPFGAGVDIGAIECREVPNGGPFQLGVLTEDGTFLPESNIDIMPILHWRHIKFFGLSQKSRILRVLVPSNKYTDDNTNINVDIRSCDLVGNAMSVTTIPLHRVGQKDGLNIFYSDRTILFTNTEEAHNISNPWSHIVYARAEGGYSFVCYTEQFK